MEEHFKKEADILVGIYKYIDTKFDIGDDKETPPTSEEIQKMAVTVYLQAPKVKFFKDKDKRDMLT